LRPREFVAKILVQVIAVLNAFVRLADEPVVSVWTTGLQLFEPLDQHIDREATDPQVPGEME
jgi:hypothetical protein